MQDRFSEVAGPDRLSVKRGGAPLIGIGMPVYNCGEYIGQAIESHLAQTFGDFELVITDNQSTDATEEVCRRYVASDPRVRYIRNPTNVGGPGNFRLAFAHSRGQYHKWSTADDWWGPTFLADAVAVLDRDPETVLVYPRTVMVDEAGQETGRFEDSLHLRDERPSNRFIRLYNTITLCQAHLGLMRRDVMARTGLIGGELASDIRFLAELSLYGKFFVLPEYLFFRRFHQTCSSWNRTDMTRQGAYYAPRGSGFRFHAWRRYGALVLAVARAPIAATERLRLVKYIGGLATQQRGRLFREITRMGKPDPKGLHIR
ncbi:MAG TPA: glycosyltransferase family 2 protein [Gemmatimonadales bacterium]|nr:glycosyltransferase family 2 protein [Gemmatimonadales bacterium]